MRSDAKDVDTYLALAPDERRAVLGEIRDMCRELLTGFDESMSYGMPTYGREGIPEIAWASQKQYISVYVMRADVLDAHRDWLAHLSGGKGCIRYRSPAAIDFAVIRSVLTAVASSRGPISGDGEAPPNAVSGAAADRSSGVVSPDRPRDGENVSGDAEHIWSHAVHIDSMSVFHPDPTGLA